MNHLRCKQKPKTLHMPQRKRMPVTILTGFLGAGKTTLLNYILKQQKKRLAVVENDFGEISIDKELVAANLEAKENLVSIGKGCVCCSVRSDIIRALEMLERRSIEHNITFDAIILETTGLADPAPIVFTFFVNPWIAARFKIDSIICVLDARFGIKKLTVDNMSSGTVVNEFIQQLAFSDLILLNKIDLVNDHQIQQVKMHVKNINHTANIIECQLNKADTTGTPSIDKIIGIDSFSIHRAIEVDDEILDCEDEDANDDSQINGGGGDDDDIIVDNCDSSDNDASSSLLQLPLPLQLPLVQKALPSSSLSSCSSCISNSFSNEDSEDGNEEEEGCDIEENSISGRESIGSKRRNDDTLILSHNSKIQDSHLSFNIYCGPRPKRTKKLMHDAMGICSFGITAVDPLHQWRFNMFIKDFFSERHEDIYRCKGILCIKGYESVKFVFQGVHDILTYGYSKDPWAEDEPKISKLIFIGKNLNKKHIMEAFRSCVWTPMPEGWEEYMDEENNRPYYLNKETRQIQYEMPFYVSSRNIALTPLMSTKQANCYTSTTSNSH